MREVKVMMVEDEALEVVADIVMVNHHLIEISLSYPILIPVDTIWKTGWDVIGCPNQTKICIFS